MLQPPYQFFAEAASWAFRAPCRLLAGAATWACDGHSGPEEACLARGGRDGQAALTALDRSVLVRAMRAPSPKRRAATPTRPREGVAS
jgi:hypothetical protein